MIRFSSSQHPLPYFTPLQFWLLVLAISLIASGGIGSVLYLRQYRQSFYPGTIIDSVAVGGLTAEQAKAKLSTTPDVPEFQVEVKVENIAVASTSSQLGIHKNIDESIQNAINYAKHDSPLVRVYNIALMQFEPKTYSSPLIFETQAVTELLEQLKIQVDTPNREPAARLATSNAPATLTIEPGQFGRTIDLTTAQSLIHPPLDGVSTSWEIPVASTGAQLTTDQVTDAKKRASTLVAKNIVFQGKDLSVSLNDQDLIELLAFPTGFSEAALESVLASWEAEVTRPPQDAAFVYDPTTLKVTTFQPHRDGLTLDRNTTLSQLKSLITELETAATATSSASSETKTATLAVTTTPPAKTLASTNDLGINELIGYGDSQYDHSIPNRIHNVALTSNKINLIIIKPGAEFSFNKSLGDVSTATGFRQAYIIKDGQTVLGDGGGVCQVSTTLFRSVLNAGLPVTKRKAHSYRVSYYELDRKPGVDATVYSGDVDLRFVNDTGHHILLYSEADSQNLDMKIEIYGTSDGRTAEIVDHKTWDARPAPPAVMIPDPSLAPGQKKQIDFAASGIRASFTNVVRDKNGEVLRSDTYTSNYVPWAAKYLVGP